MAYTKPWLSIDQQLDLLAQRGLEIVSHNKQKTGLPLAIWIACEVWDFGATSKLCGGLTEGDQDYISQKYGLKNGRVFASWLETLNYLRNVCAHHSRLWNRNMERQPKLPDPAEIPSLRGFPIDAHALARCFLQVLMLTHLVKILYRGSAWPEKVISHFESFPQLEHVGLNLAGMGAPKHWKELLRQ